MNAEEKLSDFLDLASDYLDGGYRRNSDNDTSLHTPLPLAYTTPESVESLDSADSAESNDYAESDSSEESYISEDVYTSEESYVSEEPESSFGLSIKSITEEISKCSACGLAATRTNTVPGEGVSHPFVMVIGEGPGADEDKTGKPFVGKAGQLLDRMLASIGLSREKNCYIANIVKCRPPGNRDPDPKETAACFPYLERQILLLKPLLILCVGRVAAQCLLNTSQGINALRGEFIELKIADTSVPVLPTFHPSALLRDESLKRPAWEDLKLLRTRLASISKEYALEKLDD